ncbi:hypothetical protein SAMN05216174_103328 [Actinokineospora iranica]|uniref:HNH endonuclease n=2 Tax=Actinokineospora iranica TaxID=1271860 RepID=A0A1G6NEU4_9PSEU|nr:hypothetical protein SAMN05216174_103328 [Actinokineospora iranica]
MYCGDNLGTDIDHFDPMSRSPRRTFDWLNHLLACSACNSHHKRDRFPVDSEGNPLLIDPTAEDPFDHLLLALSVGEYQPLSDKGRVTIEVFGLNRPLLARGRQQARRVVSRSLRELWRALGRGDEKAVEEALLCIREQPLADVCQAMVRLASTKRAQIVFGQDEDLVGPLRNPEMRGLLTTWR